MFVTHISSQSVIAAPRPTNSSSKHIAAVAAGATIGVVLFLAAVGGILYWRWRRREPREASTKSQQKDRPSELGYRIPPPTSPNGDTPFSTPIEYTTGGSLVFIALVAGLTCDLVVKIPGC